MRVGRGGLEDGRGVERENVWEEDAREGVGVGRGILGLSGLVEETVEMVFIEDGFDGIEGFGNVGFVRWVFVLSGGCLGLGRGRSRSSSVSDVVASSDSRCIGFLDGADLVVEAEGFFFAIGGFWPG